MSFSTHTPEFAAVLCSFMLNLSASERFLCSFQILCILTLSIFTLRVLTLRSHGSILRIKCELYGFPILQQKTIEIKLYGSIIICSDIKTHTHTYTHIYHICIPANGKWVWLSVSHHYSRYGSVIYAMVTFLENIYTHFYTFLVDTLVCLLAIARSLARSLVEYHSENGNPRNGDNVNTIMPEITVGDCYGRT